MRHIELIIIFIYAIGIKLICGFKQMSKFDISIFTTNIKGIYNDVSFESKFHDDPKNEFIDHYFETISRKIRLQDGRQVTCKIPVLAEPMTIPNEEIDQLKEVEERPKKVLTSSEIAPVLSHLHEICTNLRMKEFIWEFCPQKHARQYDDATTIMNVHKPAAELFYLGFYDRDNSYNNKNIFQKETLTSSISSAPANQYVNFKAKNEKKLFLTDMIAKIIAYPYLSTLNQTKSYGLSLYVPYDILKPYDKAIKIDFNGKYLHDYIEDEILSNITKMVDNITFVKVEMPIKSIVASNIILLEDHFPLNIITSNFSIIKMTKKDDLDKKLHSDRILESKELIIYKKYLYGKKAKFMTIAEKGSNIIITTEDHHFVARIIANVWDDKLIELNKPIPGIETGIISDYHIIDNYNKKLLWKMGKGIVIITGNLVFGKATNFKNHSETDFIASYERDKLQYQNVFKIKKIISNTLMIIESRLSSNDYKGEYLIGSIYDYSHIMNTLLNTNSIIDLRNSSIQENIVTPTGIIFEKKKPSFSKLVCHENFKFFNSYSWLLKFKATKFNKDKSSHLRLYLTNDHCKRDGIEISFENMERFIVKEVGKKSNFEASDLHYDINSTILKYEDTTIWILYENGILRIGHADEIRLNTQLMKYELKTKMQLGYFNFEYRETFNLQVYNLENLAITPELSYVLANFTNLPTFGNYDVSYIEHYTKGSYCPARKGSRTADIEYKCSKNNQMLAIENMTEPSVCHYHIVIGTSLLCPTITKEQNESPYLNSIICKLDDFYWNE